MTLAQLRCFLTVCNSGSMTRAAEILCMTQPAVSANVHALEKEFGALLFRRTGRTLELTDAGEHLKPKAEILLSYANNVKATMARYATTSRRIALGISPNCYAAFSEILATLSGNDSGIPNFSFRTFSSSSLERGIRSGKLDIAIVTVPTGYAFSSAVDSLLIGETCLSLVTRDPAFKSAERLTCGDTKTIPLVLYSESPIDEKPKGNPYVPNPLDPQGANVVMVTSSLQAVLTLVEEGEASTIIIREHASGHANLNILPIEDVPPVEFRIIWKRSSNHLDELTPVVDVLLQKTRLCLARP